MARESEIEMLNVQKANSSKSVSIQVPDEAEADRLTVPGLDHQTSRLLTSMAARTKQIVTLVILVVVLLAAVSG